LVAQEGRIGQAPSGSFLLFPQLVAKAEKVRATAPQRRWLKEVFFVCSSYVSSKWRVFIGIEPDGRLMRACTAPEKGDQRKYMWDQRSPVLDSDWRDASRIPVLFLQEITLESKQQECSRYRATHLVVVHLKLDDIE